MKTVFIFLSTILFSSCRAQLSTYNFGLKNKMVEMNTASRNKEFLKFIEESREDFFEHYSFSKNNFILVENVDAVVNWTYSGVIYKNDSIYKYSFDKGNKKKDFENTVQSFKDFSTINPNDLDLYIIKQVLNDKDSEISKQSQENSKSGGTSIIITDFVNNDKTSPIILPSFVVFDKYGKLKFW